MKSTVDEIRQRFDNDVERFSNLELGQSATMDAPLAMDLVAAAAAAVTPHATHVLDVGCGAGNYTLKLMQRLPGLQVALIDLSRPMLERAQQRIQAAHQVPIEALQGDVREIDRPAGSCDIILAAAVLHHLRTDAEWEAVFRKFHHWLRPGGSLWIFDLIESELSAVSQVMWARYGQYLEDFKGADYRQHVLDYIAQEDTPRSMIYQLDLLRRVGFRSVEVLHKTACFAAFGAVKS